MDTLIWFRNDLRIDDNSALRAALRAALRGGGRVTGIFYATPEQWREHAMAPVKAEFLWRTLHCLRDDLCELGVPLHVKVVERFADIAADLVPFANKLRCGAVFANREYAVDEQRRDAAVQRALEKAGVAWQAFDDSTLLPPGSVGTQQGQPFKVFTPFRRALLERLETTPLHGATTPKAKVAGAVPPRLPAYPYERSSVPAEYWPAGETAARQRLEQFVSEKLDDYARRRDTPACDGTSMLSPYLALGAISLRRCAEAALAHNRGRWSTGNAGAVAWLNELLWREFYVHTLAQFPRVSMNKPLRAFTEQVRWRHADTEFRRWCEGRTCFPLVDAAMRQLSQTGWMHNRLRMLAAMFLSKYLLIDWRRGEAHFMRHLIDGDLAANNGGWQWCASTGTDAVPYFRMLQPVRQAERFDPDGIFCKRFLPELKEVPARLLLQPGHPQLLGAGYPAPLVDLKAARERALQAFAAAGEQARASAAGY